jgi:SAM-dependent methyltransferase
MTQRSEVTGSSGPTRWDTTMTGPSWQAYVDRFGRAYERGDDLEGEARFVDALAPRGAAVLDAGCGTGRIAAALHRAGHRVLGVDRDAGQLAVGAQRYPGVPLLQLDLLDITPQALSDVGAPDSFDVVALPGNVLVFVAPGTERAVLAALTAVLAPAGRLVAGFATDRDYTLAAFDRDAVAVGLTLEHRFASWHLDPWPADPAAPAPGWAVSVLRRTHPTAVDRDGGHR